MPIRAIARLIQTMLYARRFFPYYVYNILGGIEDDGEFDNLMTAPGMLNTGPFITRFLSVDLVCSNDVLIHFP